MSRPITEDDDGGLRDLIGDLVDLVEGRSRLTPSERLDVIELAQDEARQPTLVYAETDCPTCIHNPK